MDRFNSITFDERTWTIEYDDLKGGYYIYTNNHSYSYFHSCFLEDSGIVGIEHVDRNTFLIYSKFKEFYSITRILILKNEYEILYENFSLKNLLSLNKQTILIKSPECPVVYNVKTNSEFNLSFLQDTSFSLLEKNDKNYLYCSKPIISTNKYFRSIDYLNFVLDVEILQPVLPVFSTLRGSFIDVICLSYIENFVEEEQYYKEIVDNELAHLNTHINNSGKQILLSSFNQAFKNND